MTNRLDRFTQRARRALTSFNSPSRPIDRGSINC